MTISECLASTMLREWVWSVIPRGVWNLLLAPWRFPSRACCLHTRQETHNKHHATVSYRWFRVSQFSDYPSPLGCVYCLSPHIWRYPAVHYNKSLQQRSPSSLCYNLHSKRPFCNDFWGHFLLYVKWDVNLVFIVSWPGHIIMSPLRRHIFVYFMAKSTFWGFFGP